MTRAANALNAMTRLGIDARPELIRAENNVVAFVGDEVVAKAVESSRDVAIRKEAQIINELAGCEHVVNQAATGIGPYECDGWTIILLERLTPVQTPPSKLETFRSLRKLHEAMSKLDVELPTWTQQAMNTAEAWRANPFKPEQETVAQVAYDRFVQQVFAYDGEVQVLHGDAWTGQSINTADGLRWIDFESASIGPKEWDLAPSAEVEGYGPFDEGLWRTLKLVRSWTVAVWSHVNSAHSPQLVEHVDFHINLLARALSDN